MIGFSPLDICSHPPEPVVPHIMFRMANDLGFGQDIEQWNYYVNTHGSFQVACTSCEYGPDGEGTFTLKMFGNLEQIEAIGLVNSGLVAFNFDAAVNALYVDITSNPGVSVTISGMLGVTQLRAELCALTVMPQVPVTLETLHLERNNFAGTVTIPDSVKQCYIAENQITDLQGTQNSQLRVLGASNNLIANASVLNSFPQITGAGLGYNLLTAIELPSTIKTLTLSENPITEIDISNCLFLEEAELNDCPMLTDVKGLDIAYQGDYRTVGAQFCDLPLLWYQRNLHLIAEAVAAGTLQTDVNYFLDGNTNANIGGDPLCMTNYDYLRGQGMNIVCNT